MHFLTRVARTALVAAAFPLAACTVRTAATPPRAGAESLGPGMTWWRHDDPRGPWRTMVVRVDLTQPGLTLRAVHARDSIASREATSSIVARANARPDERVRVAINADFFDLRTGQSENNQVTDGEWWVGRMLTDSPYDSYDNVHSQFALSHDGRGSIGRYVPHARAWASGGELPLLGINHMPAGVYEGAALYTSRSGAVTPRAVGPSDSTRRWSEVTLRNATPRGDTLVYVVQRVASTAGETAIPRDGAVITAHGDRAKVVQGWAAGDTVRVWIGTSPRLSDGRPPLQLIGGWPRILEAGANVAADAPIREGTISRNAEARHPRSAIGVSRDGRTLWLFAVDGRTTASVGMTLVELADAMRALGAWDALNFDGGGSTTLVIDGRVVNTPSDATGERAVGNALLVLQRK